jgi:uncharacterized membrane protein
VTIMMTPVIRVSLFLCSAGGLYVCSYFALVFYDVIAPDAKYVPRSCQLDAQTCQSVIRHPDARILGAPNFMLGIPYYVVMVVVAFVDVPRFVHVIALCVSWGTVVLATYLVHSLYVKVKIICPLCLVSHSLNLIIAILLML